MPGIFEPVNISTLALKNRVMRSATWDGAADEQGRVTDDSISIYRELARGQIGLIISGHAFVSPHGQATPNQYGIYSDEMIPGLKRLTDAVHAEGSKMGVQITHSGINSIHLARQNKAAWVVSEKDNIKRPQHQMTEDDIEELMNDFAAAAGRAVDAGFDIIQLHGAHGYLLSQFLSPIFNERQDRWGGSLENRRRVHLGIIERVRRMTGRNFPLMIKFGVQDDADDGLTLAEGIETAQAMVEKGIDAIEVSAGVGAGRAVPRRLESDPEDVFFRERTAALKKAVSVPVILVGGIRSKQTADEIIASSDADIVSMCRPFIREPRLLARWQGGDDAAARCISCNKCAPGASARLHCGEDERLRKEAAAGA